MHNAGHMFRMSVFSIFFEWLQAAKSFHCRKVTNFSPFAQTSPLLPYPTLMPFSLRIKKAYRLRYSPTAAYMTIKKRMF